MPLIYLFFLLLPLLGQGQRSYRIQDSFPNLDNTPWIKESKVPGITIGTKQGAYLIRIESGSGYSIHRGNDYVDWNAPFDIEAEIELKALSEKGTAGSGGLGFAGESLKKVHRFIFFQKTGSAMLYERNVDKSSVAKKVYPKTLQPLFRGKQQLKISYSPYEADKRKGRFLFQVQGRTVADTLLEIYGTQLQLFANPNTELLLHSFAVKQEHPDIRLADALAAELKPRILGEEVNTEYSDISPYISPNGKTLYYSIKNSPENVGGTKDKDDVWLSRRNAQGNWSVRENIGPPLNTPRPNSVIGISLDGRTLYLRGIYEQVEDKNAGISYSRQERNGNWGQPKTMHIQGFENRATNSEFSLSADEQFLLMTIQTKTSYSRYNNNRDIYVSVRLNDSSWSEPRNIGPVVNSFGNEISPFLAADGKTLYFSSDGHSGYGSNDIFMSTRLDDTWTNWSEPLNLGAGINTPKWDAYFSIPASGEYGYMSSSSYRKDMRSDIVEFPLPEKLKPRAMALLQGLCYDMQEKQALEARVYYAPTPRNLQNIQSLDILDGEQGYSMLLDADTASYELFAEKSGYFGPSVRVDIVPGTSRYQEYKANLELYPLLDSQVVALPYVFLYEEQAEAKEQASRIDKLLGMQAQVVNKGGIELRPESFPQVARIEALLKEQPLLSIELEGEGSRAIQKHLELLGIDKERIGLGASDTGQTSMRLLAPPRA